MQGWDGLRGLDFQGMGAYTALWAGLLLLGVAVAIKHRSTLGLFSPGYRRFLATPWRLVTFVLATFSLAVIAPYTGDPTWDYWDASLMGVLTFATAPWVMGCVHRAWRRQARLAEIYVAVIAWMTSASWSYDLYVLLRDGIYPASAVANIVASSVLYVAAGLFWSLDWRPGRGVTFAFLETDWSTVGAPGAFPQLAGYALAFMALVTLTLGWVFLL
jgi:hypothetical protein